ncbi:MAG: alcohol dehydrogenase catalytic domain-containing protein [Mycobacteriales bacterium]
MRQVVINPDRSVEVVDAPDPTPPDARGAVVEVEASAICGSDLHFYDGDLPLVAPLPIGHEFIGRVVEVGSEVRRFGAGDRVLVAAVTGCGSCDGCATGDPIRCVLGPEIFGSGTLGAGQASAVAVPAADFQMYAIPDGVDDRAALLLTDNLGTGWAGARRADFASGDTVVVLGLGAVGKCAARAAVALGAGPVLAADPVAARRELAAAYGATPIDGPTVASVMDATGGRGAAAVIDAVASDVTLNDAFGCVRAGGTVSVIGVHDLEPYPMPLLSALYRSLTLRATMAPVHQTWSDLVPMITSGRLPTDGIITHDFALDDAAKAYAAVAARSGDCLKVMMRP